MGTVTYTGNEIAFIAGVIVNQMPDQPRDFEILDLMLDRAISAIDYLDDEVLAVIEERRNKARAKFEKSKRGTD